jgi:hypothetical protein
MPIMPEDESEGVAENGIIYIRGKERDQITRGKKCPSPELLIS